MTPAALSRIRRTRRTATLVLHWTQLVLIFPLGGGWVTPFLEWSFALVTLTMSALALVFGLQAYAGPRSPWIVRLINAWGHRLLYVYLSWVGGASLLSLATGTGADFSLHYRIILIITLFHAIYHFFRHFVIRDGALRTMFPPSMHPML